MDPDAARRGRSVVPQWSLAVLVVAVLAAGLTGAASAAGRRPKVTGQPAALSHTLLPPVAGAPAPEPEPPSVASSTTTTATTIAVTPTAPAVALPPPAPRLARSPEPALPPAERLRVNLEGALSGLRGCLVVEDADGNVLDHEGTVPLTPASTQKLLVAAAALSRLGPDFRFETRVVAVRPPHDGVVDQAWLIGGGDPFLATADYAGYLSRRPRTRDVPLTPLVALADELVARGVQTIPGGLHGDDSRYDSLRYVPTWNPSYVNEVEVGPITALAVNEGLSAWEPKRVAESDPPASAAAALAGLLHQRGVAAEPAGGQTAPSGAVVLATLHSAPLGEVVAAMLRASDNFVAEVLLRELDRQAGGAGTTAGGAAQVEAEAGRLGLPADGLHLVDGSGLDTGNRASCRVLLAVLSLIGQPQFSALDRGLAVAGQSGTLVHRFVGSPLAGRLAAKTGWINGVAAMVGRIDGPRLRFALIINGNFSWPAAQAVEDRVVGLLGAYPG